MDRPVPTVGKPRLGTLHFDRSDPGRPAMVFDNGEEIEVTTYVEHGDPLERRLVGRSVTWGDDPDYLMHDYSLPEQAWFEDMHGVAAFTVMRGISRTLGSSQEIRMRFAYALKVGGVGVNYERVHAMESRIAGLSEWVPLSCVSHDYREQPDGTLASVFTLTRAEQVRVSRKLNTTIRPTYSTVASSTPGESKFEDEVRIHTRAARPRTWGDHLSIHTAMRDLLVVAGWKEYPLQQLLVSRDDDPQLSLGGTVLGPRWAPVSTYEVRQSEEVSGRSRFFYDFSEVEARGVGKWLSLRDRYSRGIVGMIHAVGIQGMALESAVAEAGAALERLAYNIALERGDEPGRRLERHLRRVSEEVACDVGVDLDTWPSRFADAYNTVKHPDRPSEWDTLDLANVLRESRLVFRAWVGRRIGVQPSVLERNVKLVPMSRAYHAW